MSDKPIIIRVRGKDGTFRIKLDPNKNTLLDLKKEVEKENGVPHNEMNIYLDVKHDELTSNDNKSLSANKIQTNGQMVYLLYDKAKVKSKQDLEEEEKQKEKEDIFGTGEDLSSLGLKYRKKNWTMKEYMELVEKNTVQIQHQKYAVASKAFIDVRAAQLFQQFLTEMAYTINRVGYVYGTLNDGEKPDDEESDSDDEDNDKKPDPNENVDLHDFKEVTCTVIYEPLQDGDEKGFVDLSSNDSHLDRAGKLSSMFGMQRVGTVFSHNDVRMDYLLSNTELITAAKNQDKYGESFVTIIASKNEDGKTKFETFQASKQCVDLVRRGLLSPVEGKPNRMKCKYPVKIQRKEAKEIDVRLLTTIVRMFSTQSIFRAGFPPRNRPSSDHAQSLERLRNVLKQRQNLPFVQRISDFHLLLFLTDYLSLSSDFPALTEAVKTQNNNMAIGFEHLINAYCGLD